MTNHTPVMLTEAIEALHVQPNEWYIDATFGQGGHTRAILERGGNVIAFDFDEMAVAEGQNNFQSEIEQHHLILIRENFDKLSQEIEKLHLAPISGILFDFGTSAQQLTSTKRGLSFQGSDEELDMRLDTRLGVKAKDLLALLGEKQLSQVFSELGGEREAKAIAKEIVTRRKKGQFITTVGQLVTLIEKTKRQPSTKIHAATKVFQALRIATNDELSNIQRALPQALELVQPGGTIITIAFHEGEDRIAKQLFAQWEKAGFGQRQPSDALTPSDRELVQNPRSRSAKLRIFIKNN